MYSFITLLICMLYLNMKKKFFLSYHILTLFLAWSCQKKNWSESGRRVYFAQRHFIAKMLLHGVTFALVVIFALKSFHVGSILHGMVPLTVIKFFCIFFVNSTLTPQLIPGLYYYVIYYCKNLSDTKVCAKIFYVKFNWITY